MKAQTNPTVWKLLLVAAMFVALPETAYAKGKKSGPTEVAIPGPGSNKGPKEADVEQIQEKYWARGEESEIGVVQNRLYTNRKKLEFGFNLGSVSSDPFLVNTSLSGTVGYHFSDLFSVHLGYTQNFVWGSEALKSLEQFSGSGKTAVTNKQKNWITLDTRWSMLYGKVSLFGAKILYFDSYLSAGVGIVNTENGSSLAIMPGIGQVYHISQTVGLNLHYKLFLYDETLKSRNTASLNAVLGTHGNFGSTIMLGLTITLDPFSAPAENKDTPKP